VDDMMDFNTVATVPPQRTSTLEYQPFPEERRPWLVPLIVLGVVTTIVLIVTVLSVSGAFASTGAGGCGGG
jgi:hypothetical protein